MSGSFVQRGGVAIYDKWTRARSALENGADTIETQARIKEYVTESIEENSYEYVDTDVVAERVFEGLPAMREEFVQKMEKAASALQAAGYEHYDQVYGYTVHGNYQYITRLGGTYEKKNKKIECFVIWRYYE